MTRTKEAMTRPPKGGPLQEEVSAKEKALMERKKKLAMAAKKKEVAAEKRAAVARKKRESRAAEESPIKATQASRKEQTKDDESGKNEDSEADGDSDDQSGGKSESGSSSSEASEEEYDSDDDELSKDEEKEKGYPDKTSTEEGRVPVANKTKRKKNRTDNDEEEQDELNTFELKKYLDETDKETPLVAYGLQQKISMGFLPLSFFVHQNDDILFCQPQINHRNDILVKAATEEKSRGKGFEEEVFAIIYEVTSEGGENAVPIYSTYQTGLSEDVSPYQIPNVFAKFPSKAGILKMLKSLNMTSIIESTEFKNATDETVGFLTKEFFWKVFHSDLFEKMNVCSTDFFPNTTEAKKLTEDDKTFPQAYRRIKREFQLEHNIRFAFMGGNHRIATAVHLFGGYQVEPNPTLNKASTMKDYGLQLKMKITASPSITVILPESGLLSEEFIDQCNVYSYIVEKRKTESIEVTYRSLSSTILNENKHPEIVTKDRFLPDLVFTEEKAMTQINNWRTTISSMEAALLLTNPPTKQVAVATKFKNNEEMDENERVTYWENNIRTFTSTSALHQGVAHGTSKSSSKVKFPEPLLCILWIHCWAVADESSLKDFKNLLKTDIEFKVQQKRRFDFYNPAWLRKNIINNVVKTIKVLVDDSKGEKEFKGKYGDPKKIATRLKASLTHFLTTEIVKNLVWCGPNPKSLPPKDGTDDIEIEKQAKNLKDIDDQLRINISTINDLTTDVGTKRFLPITYTEAILAAIPNIIQANMDNPISGGLFDNILKDHPKQGGTQATWIPGTSWSKFKIYIPVTTTNIPGESSNVSSLRKPDCDITSFFQSVLQGDIPSKLLFLQPDKDKKDKNAKGKKPKIDFAKAKQEVMSIVASIECLPDKHFREVLTRKIKNLCAICNIEEEIPETKPTKTTRKRKRV